MPVGYTILLLSAKTRQGNQRNEASRLRKCIKKSSALSLAWNAKKSLCKLNLLHCRQKTTTCCYPPSNQDKCLPPGAGAATASAACVQAVLLSAGFLRVLVTHCLLCEKRRVDLFQVREQRFSQPLWLSSSCSFVRSLEPRPRAVLQFN